MLPKLDTVWAQLLAPQMRNNFPKTADGCTASFFVKMLRCSRWLINPLPQLRQYIALFAIAEGWLLLDIG